jgi:hypothetical protein
MSYFLKLIPESRFKANAGFVSIKYEGTFSHG